MANGTPDVSQPRREEPGARPNPVEPEARASSAGGEGLEQPVPLRVFAGAVAEIERLKQRVGELEADGSGVAEVIRTRRLEVVDDEGRVRAEIRFLTKDEVAPGAGTAVQLYLESDSGRRRCSVTVDELDVWVEAYRDGDSAGHWSIPRDSYIESGPSDDFEQERRLSRVVLVPRALARATSVVADALHDRYRRRLRDSR